MKRKTSAADVKRAAALQAELAEQTKQAKRWEARAVFLEKRAQEATERRKGGAR